MGCMLIHRIVATIVATPRHGNTSERTMQYPDSTPRHAYLVLAHKSARQINLLTRLLLGSDGCTAVYLHLDAKAAHLAPDITPRSGLRVVSTRRISWGGFDMVRATLDLLRLALADEPFDYLHLCSGQCLPLWPVEQIAARMAGQTRQYMACVPFPVPGLPYQGFDRILVEYPPHLRGRYRGVKARQLDDYKEAVLRDPARHRRVDHLPRLYHGSQWFSITGAFARHVLDYVDARPEFAAFFEASLIPDEMFFQTILMDSPFAPHIEQNTHRYMDWIQGGPHTLRLADLPAVLHSGLWFARKFDLDRDAGAVARIAHIVRLRAVRPELSNAALLEAARHVNDLAAADPPCG